MADAKLCHGETGGSNAARLRIPAVLAAAMALAGCNASQAVDPSAGPMNTSGRFANHYNPYNPVTYGQTAGFYGGR